MRWKVPIVDPTLPHQIIITTDSFHLYVSCNCLTSSGNVIGQIIPGVNDPRIAYQRWHREREIPT